MEVKVGRWRWRWRWRVEVARFLLERVRIGFFRGSLFVRCLYVCALPYLLYTYIHTYIDTYMDRFMDR